MCWMSWDQANIPFCDEIKNYVRKINIIEDMNRLSKTIKMRDVNINYIIIVIKSYFKAFFKAFFY
jgi:hypothetical protein